MRIVWKKAVSEFGNLPYCDTPGCPIHETPTASPVKTLPTKRKDEDGFTSPPPSKTCKNNVSYQENFKLNLANRFKNLKSQDTEATGTSRTINAKNTTLQPKANPASKNLPPPVFLVITENHRSQMKKLDDIYPHLRSKLTGSPAVRLAISSHLVGEACVNRFILTVDSWPRTSSKLSVVDCALDRVSAITRFFPGTYSN
ncbi:hypothetical protein TNIN_436571 [Trichonephila inaurata madagascariensis]|uniref:Uncharacterized protein n=1 Tax=Trichonephila inaurata madagascariensis TaxID=2747483 RepID=A0A8X7CDZ1_9ARAC|nr:hypothetical protein TNIN_436571 [Trichonephila inaurata madagascariensis]